MNKKYGKILPIIKKNIKLRLKIRLLHSDSLCGLKPLISIAIFGTILEAIVFSSLLILYINIDDFIGLVLAISLAIFIGSSGFFVIDRVRQMVIPSKRKKMEIILKKIEDKHRDILYNKIQNYKESTEYLELHEKILETYHIFGRLPLDSGTIVQIISGAAIPLILFFLSRLF